MDDLDALLARRVRRGVSEPVDAASVERWCARFDWPAPVGDPVPGLMFPVLVRPSAPLVDGSSTGVELHDGLKSALGLPVAIAVGYELEVLGDVRVGDRLASTECIASLGEPRRTRFGEGRDWVIEVATATTGDAPVGIERFRMLGYRPGDGVEHGAGARSESVESEWVDEVAVDAGTITGMAAANRVWAPAHHRPDAARAAGLADIILDTSSQVALLADAARRRRPAGIIRSVDLAMKRPVLPGAVVRIGGTSSGDRSLVVASVDGREVSRATIVFSA